MIFITCSESFQLLYHLSSYFSSLKVQYLVMNHQTDTNRNSLNHLGTICAVANFK